MHPLLIGQVFCQSQGDLGSDQPLYHRIVCQIDKHGNVLGNAALLKGSAEEIRHVMLYAHSSENNGKGLIRTFSQRRLLYDLGCQLVMGKAVS